MRNKMCMSHICNCDIILCIDFYIINIFSIIFKLD